MSWRFTLEDRMAFQKVRRQLADVLQVIDGQLAKPLTTEGLKRLRTAHAQAEKARYPTNDPDQVAVLRQWMKLAEALFDAELDAERRMAIAGLSCLVPDVALILGPFPTPPSGADPAAPPWWLD